MSLSTNKIVEALIQLARADFEDDEMPEGWRVGARVTCEHCQHTWLCCFSLPSTTGTLECPRCYNRTPIPEE